LILRPEGGPTKTKEKKKGEKSFKEAMADRGGDLEAFIKST